MRSNFAQPAGGHEGLFRHAYSPTDAELLARARAWLAAGGVMVRTEGEGDRGPVVCWHVRTAEGITLEGLADHLAVTLTNYGDLERTEKGARVTLFSRREP